MPYDYAPRLTLLARARHRRHVLLTVCLLALPALSLNAAPPLVESAVSVVMLR